jgi:hypothetical protein
LIITERRRFRIPLFFILFIIIFTTFLPHAGAQSLREDSCVIFPWNFDENEKDESSSASIISDLFEPQLIIDTRLIRKYVLDERFQVLRCKYGDIPAVDAIYLKSLGISDHNISRALFISMMAVFEHRYIDIKVPFFKYIRLPLTFEKDSVFKSRINHLPSDLYTHKLKKIVDDRDKLQHFFGSAYLAYASEAPSFALTFGDLIEWGEASFIVGGTDDIRDKRANNEGKSFGRDLLVIKTLLPSDYLTFSNQEGK